MKRKKKPTSLSLILIFQVTGVGGLLPLHDLYTHPLLLFIPIVETIFFLSLVIIYPSFRLALY